MSNSRRVADDGGGSRRDTASGDRITCEVEVIPGLEQIARDELRSTFGRAVKVEPQLREGLLPILWGGDLHDLLDLRTALAVYGLRYFAVPRPKALLGHEHFIALLSMIDVVRELHPPATFRTFRISSAGADSPVMLRLRAMLAEATGLEPVDEEGDLLIRLRRPLGGEMGWDVLIRLSPRPLSVRSWRVCNLPGALNATVAQAMVRLSRPHPDDFVLNVCCGSATLLIECLAYARARVAVGCDLDTTAIACAAENLVAASYGAAHIFDWDAQALPLPERTVDTILVDLPFGHTIGSHSSNLHLYPRLLDEAARVMINGGTLVAITEDIRLWRNLIADRPDDWSMTAAFQVKIPFASGHLHPEISVIQRR